MSKPLSPKILHIAFICIEAALLWIGVALLMIGNSPVLALFFGTILVGFVLAVHLIAWSLTYLLPKADTKHHQTMFIASIALPLVLVAVLVYGMFFSLYYVLGYAAQDNQRRQEIELECTGTPDPKTCVEDHLELID